MIDRLIAFCVHNRMLVLPTTLVFVLFGIYSFRTAVFDAFPDLTGVQVQILTANPGMSSEEIEKLVTVPVERSLSGLPGLVELRSRSRTGISAVTAVFRDSTDLYLARQLVKERLDLAREEIPETAGLPEIAPPSTGLGEVYQMTIRGEGLTPYETYRIFERDIAPRLRTVEGVVEVNAWGGGSPRLEIRADPFALVAHDVQLAELRAQLEAALGVAPAGARDRAAERTLLRALSNPADPGALADLEISAPGGPVRLGELADVVIGGAPTVGLGTADGEGEAMFAMVQLLAGADGLRTAEAIDTRLEEIRTALPEEIVIESIYERTKLVGNSLKTVAKSLIEGGLLVIVVLFLLLGDWRAGLLVASVIPMAMLGAFTGLKLTGYSGNLMSLGAIDFGLIVDGTIVVVESIAALTVVRAGDFNDAVIARTRKVARPVLFAVGILLLVYVPILLLQGIEGKLFRPMALTVLFALATALVLSFTYIPAMASWMIRPGGDHHSAVERFLRGLYVPVLGTMMKRPLLSAAIALALTLLSGVIASRMGIELTPRLEEGDVVVQTERLPSISPEQAMRESTRIETILGTFPEVERVASRTGAPAVATDPMGLEESDILVRLKPKHEWETASTLDGLFGAFASRLETEAPGAVFAYTQPIEMRFNELLEGITTDVGVRIYGNDLGVLTDLGQRVAEVLDGVPGAADISPPAVEGVPLVTVRPLPESARRFAITSDAVLETAAALEQGLPVGKVIRGDFRDDVVLLLDNEGLEIDEVPVVLPMGGSLPLGELASIETTSVPNAVDRMGGNRRVDVLANVRGRDLGSFVSAAEAAVAGLELPPGYWIEWSGKYEQLREAALRMAITIPLVLIAIGFVLHLAFQDWRLAAMVFLNIPVAASGGFLLLMMRGLPISLSAVVGFIALAGIAVMNGIVLLSRTRELNAVSESFEAARQSALERFRPVIMTASVAGIGFLPMAIATGVGAEVQRPLATVVIGGLITCTALTLLVVPSLYARVFMRRKPANLDDVTPDVV